MPRHPPCALKHLQHKKPKNEFRDLLQKETLKLHINTQTATHPHKGAGATCVLDARNHYPQIKHHTPPPTWSDNQSYPRFPITGRRDSGPVASKPNSVSGNPSTGVSPPASTFVVAPEPHPLQVQPIVTIRCDHRTPTRCGRAAVSWCSLERR
jgi:hypothetical protein